MAIERKIERNCCNTDSYGEICVKCGLCEKKISDMRGCEFREVLLADKLL